MKSYNIENSFPKTILPKLGGRIDSLIFKPNDKEWVWKTVQSKTIVFKIF